MAFPIVIPIIIVIIVIAIAAEQTLQPDLPPPPPPPPPIVDDFPDIADDLPSDDVDTDPDILFGKDPKVFGDWKMIPVDDNYHCELLSNVYRVDWDNDGFYECGTYTYQGKILMNNPIYDTRLSITQFEGNEFTHTWEDINQNMIIDTPDILTEQFVLLNGEVESYPWGERHTNGNLKYAVQYSNQLEEMVYSTEMRYWMRGV